MRLARGLALSLLGSIGLAAAQVPARVTTDKGVVEGERTADAQVMAFKGIPYAAPPVGDLRWKPPLPAEPWTGVRSAHRFGYHCVQSGSYPDMLFHDGGASEDCLTLNVWTPKDARPGSLPVMVWIYGGGLQTGGTSENRQDGEFLARKDVVVVSMNYRLGIFGFFTHPDLAAESPDHAAGNYGLMDQNAALQWVQHNIAAFGGDPKQVTIFGESAGSFSVNFQMASPKSRGLFARAIGESGGAIAGSNGLLQKPLAVREAADSLAAGTLYGTDSLTALRALSTEDLIRPILAHPGAASFGPVVDGSFLPRSVAAIYAAGEEAHVPLLAGWNSGEGRGQVLGTPFSAQTQRLQLAQAFAEHKADQDELFRLYDLNGTDNAAALEGASDLAGDRFIAYGTWRWLEDQVKTGQAPVYRYLFALGNPGDRNHTAAAGAFHSDDIEYVFGTLDSRPEMLVRSQDRALSAQIQGYWTNFARTGDPNGPGLPKWPAYAPSQWETMRLDATSKAAPDTHRERYLLLDRMWGQPK